MVTCAAYVLWEWDIDSVLEECFDIICGNAESGYEGMISIKQFLRSLN